jgi:hypothetical protein
MIVLYYHNMKYINILNAKTIYYIYLLQYNNNIKLKILTIYSILIIMLSFFEVLPNTITTRNANFYYKELQNTIYIKLLEKNIINYIYGSF